MWRYATGLKTIICCDILCIMEQNNKTENQEDNK